MRNRLKSFKYAISGLAYILKAEPNARIHLLAGISVVGLGAFLDLERLEWLWIGLAIALVWILEAVNTAFEYLCDLVSPEHSESVKHAKDIAAGGVLIAAFFALFVAALVLFPKLSALFTPL